VRGYLTPVVVGNGPGGKRSFSSSSSSSGKKRVVAPEHTLGSESGTDSDSDAEDEAAARAADLSSVRAGSDEIKLVLVVNDQLKMTKGKIGAQCGHATLACYETLARSNPKVRNMSLSYGGRVICIC
jgi:PTH2 family peptidyl-tRNA hydrolase